MAAVGLLALVVVGAVELEGATTCPAPDAVAAELRGLVSDQPGTGRERVRLVDHDGGGLQLELRDEGGRTLAQRRLQAAPCEDLAKAAAVVIAAWATELRAGGAASVILPPPRSRELAFEIAGAFVASLAGASFAPGGSLQASFGEKGRRVYGRAAVIAAGVRDVVLGAAPPAHGHFTRAGLWLGPLVRFRPGRFLLDLHAEAGVALLYAAGVGFPNSRAAFEADAGLGGGARAAIRAGRAAPFVGVAVQGWLRPTSVQASGPAGGTRELPRFEVLLTAGIAFGNH